MLGAIIGDIVGSRFERHNHKSKDFDLFHPDCSLTDDSIMSLAIAKAISDCGKDYDNLGQLAVKNMQALGRQYPNCGLVPGFTSGFVWITRSLITASETVPPCGLALVDWLQIPLKWQRIFPEK